MLSPCGDPMFDVKGVDSAPSTLTSSVVSLNRTLSILNSSSFKHSAAILINSPL